MDEEHILILTLPRVYNKRGQILATMASLYYWQGNFYHPYDLIGDRIGKVKRAIQEFKSKHKDLIERDRKHPNYRTLVEIFDSQFEGNIND